MMGGGQVAVPAQQGFGPHRQPDLAYGGTGR